MTISHTKFQFICVAFKLHVNQKIANYTLTYMYMYSHALSHTHTHTHARTHTHTHTQSHSHICTHTRSREKDWDALVLWESCKELNLLLVLKNVQRNYVRKCLLVLWTNRHKVWHLSHRQIYTVHVTRTSGHHDFAPCTQFVFYNRL